MPHSVGLISTIAAAFGLALILGFVAVRLGLPALVGYLVAGILIGPATPGFDADLALAQQLAEIGVMLLMFGVGLHFSLGDLMSVRRIALPGAIAQIAAATLMGRGVAALWGWPFGQGIVFGLALSVASTVVLLRALEAHGVLESHNGRIAIGWLVVEDLAMVLVLVLLPALSTWLGGNALAAAPTLGIAASLAITLGKVAAFVALMVVVGKRLFPWLLWQVARTGKALLKRRIPIVVAEENRQIVERLRERGIQAVAGDASEPMVIVQSHLVRAQLLLKGGARSVFVGEEQLALAMSGRVLELIDAA